MEYTIRMLVVALLLIIGFVVFVALMSGWGQQGGGILKGLTDWFSKILAGTEKPPSGQPTSGLPGIGTGTPAVSGGSSTNPKAGSTNWGYT